MRLRRETGDFQIKGTYGESTGAVTYNTIRPGLTYEDFIGETVSAEPGYSLIDRAAPADDTIVSLHVSNGRNLSYNRVTGAITNEGDDGEGGVGK